MRPDCASPRLRRGLQFRAGFSLWVFLNANRGPPAPKAGALPGCATPRDHDYGMRPDCASPRLRRGLQFRAGFSLWVFLNANRGPPAPKAGALPGCATPRDHDYGMRPDCASPRLRRGLQFRAGLSLWVFLNANRDLPLPKQERYRAALRPVITIIARPFHDPETPSRPERRETIPKPVRTEPRGGLSHAIEIHPSGLVFGCARAWCCARAIRHSASAPESDRHGRTDDRRHRRRDPLPPPGREQAEDLGGLVPYGVLWRAGANENTTISFSRLPSRSRENRSRRGPTRSI